MARLSYRKIIAEAWDTTQNSKRIIRWYGIPPAVITTLAGIIWLIYQFFAFKSSHLFENWGQSFTSIVIRTAYQILQAHFSETLPIIIIGIIIGILYLLLPSFSEGALIQLIARKRNKQEIRIRDGFRYGLLSFLPLLELKALVSTFGLISILGWMSFVVRNLSWSFFQVVIPIFIFYMIIGIILGFLFTFAEFFVVIDDKKVIESVSKSSALVITHLEETLMLSILMLIIGIRIIIQILFVLLIPAVIVGVIYLIASAALSTVAIIVGGIIGLILLYIASYLNATIHVFAVAVWTFTFLDLTNEEYVSARDTAKSDK